MKKLFYCNFIIKYSVYGLIFLLPLFLMPLTAEIFEYNKQYLLFFLTSLAFLAWLAKMVVRRKLVFRFNIFSAAVLLFMFVSILNVLFSIERVSSLFGFWGRFSDNLFGILSLGVLYFVLTNNLSVLKLKGILKTFLASAAVVLLITYFSIFGLWPKLFGTSSPVFNWLPIMGTRIFNPTSGSLQGLAMYLAAVIALIIGILAKKRLEKLTKGFLSYRTYQPDESDEINKSYRSDKSGKFYYILLIFAVFLLILIDFWQAWVSLGAVMLGLIIFAMRGKIFGKEANFLILPILFVLLAGLFLIISPLKNIDLQEKPGLKLLANFPEEVLLDFLTSSRVAFQTFKEHPVFGSGRGTWFQDFTRLKPIEFNQSQLWQIRFDKASSHLIELFGTTGIVGCISWLFLIASCLLFVLKSINLANFPKIVMLFLPWFVLVCGQILYLQNTALNFSFWLFSSCLVGASLIGKKKEKADQPDQSYQSDKPDKSYQSDFSDQFLWRWKIFNWSFEAQEEAIIVVKVVLIITAAIFLGLFYCGGRFYYANVEYVRALLAGWPNQPRMNLSDQTKVLEKVVRLDNYVADYQLSLAKAYLFSAAIELQTQNQKILEERNLTAFLNYIQKAIDRGQRAVVLRGKSVGAWQALAGIYTDLINVAGEASNFAIKSLEKAIELEPSNPSLYSELARVYYLVNPKENLDRVKEYYGKALKVKPDFALAELQLIFLDEQEGKFKEAIAKLESLSARYPYDMELLFQLGRLYYNNNQIRKAVERLEIVVKITPQYSNARYILALAYEKQGDKRSALEQLNKVLELNPGHKEVLKKIEELKK